MASMEKVLAAHEARQATLEASNNPFSKGIAWIEGDLVPLGEAKIPLLDQGFLHSDLTYDVPAVWDGRFFRLDDHVDRMEASCRKMRLQLPLPKIQIKQILTEMVAKSGILDAYVEIIVTRGLKFVRQHDPQDIVNKLYMFVQPYVWAMPPVLQRVGGKAIVARTVRRVPPGAIDPTIKNLQWGDLIRGLQEAQDRESQYPLLTDGDANLTEGPGYNIVIIKDGALFTPDRGVLEGVTRRTVLEIAQRKGTPVNVQVVPVEMAFQADELFICSTAGGIMPITSIDGIDINGGQIGPVTKHIWDEYWALHYDPSHSFTINYGNS
ncbi:aminotransferase [Aspergillus pseudonomiae]|uniref:Aminotransferase n=1 Tax=Aspergillus pseudonomiae TaxID=1506151 RepID=A0A5N6HGY3_9EURO|nr:aminotransferase [Aspergillus pseudonomiae]KAB8253792.1 aminotransferase [Aspergillus pseudonomiae]KAE8397498.1 aminotransferase [Aspergillus pseudonomiae]